MERISALMDGELDDGEAVQEFKRCGGDATLVEGWATYHLIGDVLRQEAALGTGFNGRLREALAAEPTVLAPRPRNLQRRARLFALSAAAGIAGVLAVGWFAYFNHPASLEAGAGQVAEADSSMNEYLVAHHEYADSASMPSVTPYVRYVNEIRREGAMSR